MAYPTKVNGSLIVVSGPSGTGKSTIVNTVLKKMPDIVFSVSATTRDKRTGEVDGVDYFFVSQDEFQRMINNNELLEHACYVNNYYGTPKKAVLDNLVMGNNVLLDIEVQGAEQIKEQYPEAIEIFVVPPSMEELQRRLFSRGTDSKEKIQQRLEQAKVEFAKINNYDYIVVNDTLEKAVDDTVAIIASQKNIYTIRQTNIMEAYSL